MADRIALFLPSLRAGGVERVMINLAGGFARLGFDVDLVLAAPEGPYRSQVPTSVRLVDLQAGRVLASLPGLARYLHRHRPAALLSAMDHANLVALWARWLSQVSTRVVVSIHTTPSLVMKQLQHRKGRFAITSASLFYRSAHGVVAVSDGVADDFARVTGFNRGKIRTIYNPAVTPELSAMAREPLDHPWFAAGEPPVVLSVGRLQPFKGFSTLIEAFARVRARMPARLLILGNGEQRTELAAMVRDLGLEDDVSLPGYVQNPFAYMSRCSAFVLSSVWEGLPMALIEAMACGAPVISTDCPSGPAEILEGGRWGQLLPISDVDAMAAAILDTLREPPDTTASRRRAEAFSLERIAERYLEILLDRPLFGQRLCAT